MLLRYWLLLALLLPIDAMAWSDRGHQIVCGIAWQLLPADLQQEVDRLSASYRMPDGKPFRYFTSGCTLADRARGKARDGHAGWRRFARYHNWHYMNVPRNSSEVSPCTTACVLAAIHYHRARLATPGLADAARAEAMFLLGHWVADIHQPLHVSFADDRGGTAVALVPGGYYASKHLHGVWDSGILHRALGKRRWWDYATQLRQEAQLRSVAVVPALAWANESFRLATDPALGYCQWQGRRCVAVELQQPLDAAYQRRQAPVVALRLQLAGVRLARLLTEALSD